MSDEPVIVVPRIAGRSDEDVVGAECRRIFYERRLDEPIDALAERAAHDQTAVVYLRYRDAR